VVGVFAAGALASCTDETEKNPILVEPQFSEVDAAMQDLTTPGAALLVNGAKLEAYNPATSTGTGVYESFVRVSSNDPDEEGYNTSGRPVQYDENTSPTFTYDLPLNWVPLVQCGYVPGYCREFNADINQQDSWPLLDLLKARLFISTTPSIISADPTADDFGQGAGTELVWDLDGDVTQFPATSGDIYVRFDYGNSTGSGGGDIKLLIPQSAFPPEAEAACQYNGGTGDCGHYVYLYSQWGTTDGSAIGNGENNDGFEEWNTREAGYVTVTKTAETTFTREYNWDITKSVDPDAISLFEDQSYAAGYTVLVTQTGYTDRDWLVSGTVTIHNPSGQTVEIIDVSDVVTDLPGISGFDLYCRPDPDPDANPDDPPPGLTFSPTSPYSLADGETILCTYSELTGDPDDFTEVPVNTVTVALEEGGVNSATAEITFDDTPDVEVNKTVDVEDYFDDDDLTTALATGISAGDEFTYSHTYTCDEDDGDHHNTASVIGDDDVVLDEDDATFTVACLDLTVTKDASTSLERTYNWTLAKSVTPTSWDMFDGDDGTSDYTVTATPVDYDDDLLNVSGSIEVTNPNSVPVYLTAITDVLSDGNTAAVDCGDISYPYTLAAGTTLSCTYSATPDAEVDGTNTATVTAKPTATGATKEFPGSAPYSWTGVTLTKVNEFVTIKDLYTHANGTETLTVLDAAADWADGTATYNYTRTFYCGADAGTHNNTATMYGDDDEVLDAPRSAAVDVTCRDLTVTKSAATTFRRTYLWEITKSVDPEAIYLFPGQSQDAAYTVVVSPMGDPPYEDDDWAVSGGITVSNVGNPIPAVINGVADVISPDINGNAVCDDVTWPHTIPAGGTLECSYGSALPNADDRTNTATATQQNHSYASDLTPSNVGTTDYSSDPVPVTFDLENPDVEVDKDVDVTDLFKGDVSTLATATETGGTYNYSHTFTCNGDEGEWENTAKVIGDDDEVLGTASAWVNVYCGELTVTKDAAPTFTRTYHWTIQKDPDATLDMFIGESGTVDYTVTLDKTGFTDGPWAVTGNITVRNDFDVAAVLSGVTDVISGIGSVPVECDGVTEWPYTLAANAELHCTYSSSLPDAATRTNTAAATVQGDGQFASDPYDIIFGAPTTEVDAEVNVTDTNGESWGPVGDDAIWSYSRDFLCSSNPDDYTDGRYSHEAHVNTATITETGDSDNATVNVNCYAPVPSKDAAGAYDERHTWDIEKSVDPLSQTGQPGDVLDWTWTVTLSESFVNENHAVTGTISVHNPHPSASMTVDVADMLSDGTIAAVDCDPLVDGDQTSLTVAASGDGTCTYEAFPLYDPGSVLADWATSNTATVTFRGIDFSASYDVAWTVNVINGTADVDDDQESDFPTTVNAGDGAWDWTETQSHTCSTNWADYGADGTYSDTRYNLATVDGSDGQHDEATAETTYTCEASFVDIYKTTNHAPADPSLDIVFKLYDGSGNELETKSTLGIGADIQFLTALVPGDEYTICENPVPAGYTFEISVDGGNVLMYAGPPGEENPTGEIQCFDFVAEVAGTTLSFDVENSYPGGAPRTPGYWKNWNRCSGGNQDDTADKLNNYLGPIDGAGVYLLDDLLPQTVGEVTLTTCEEGIEILDANTLEGKKMASDPGFTLARAYLAARLNQDAGACTAMEFDFLGEYGFDGTFEELLTAAQNLLFDEGFDGYAKFQKKSDAATLALYYYEILDDYNNGFICTGEYSH